MEILHIHGSCTGGKKGSNDIICSSPLFPYIALYSFVKTLTKRGNVTSTTSGQVLETLGHSVLASYANIQFTVNSY
jgi:hypothetical protein